MAEIKQPSVTDERTRKIFDETHAALKPIAERSAHYDVRQLATVMMRMVELMRGDKPEDQTQIPSRHHA